MARQTLNLRRVRARRKAEPERLDERALMDETSVEILRAARAMAVMAQQDFFGGRFAKDVLSLVRAYRELSECLPREAF